MRRTVAVIILLSLGAGLACSPAAGQDIPTEEERDGVTTSVAPETANEIKSEAESVIETFDPAPDDPWGVTDPLPDDLQVRDNVVALHTRDGDTVYVLTDAEPGVAEATVTGYDLQVIGADSSIFVATGMQTSREATEVDATTFFDDPSSYQGRLVRVETDAYQQAVVAAHAVDGSVSEQYAAGTRRDAGLPVEPGGAAMDGLDEMLDGTNPDLTPGDVRAHLDNAAAALEGDVPAVLHQPGERGFVGNGSATIDVAVTSGTPRLHVLDRQWHGIDATLAEVANGSHDGEVVTVEANRTAARLSVKETVSKVADCSGDWLVVPSLGCVPNVVDVIAHAGALTDGVDTNATVVPMVGVSNTIQTTPVETVHDRALVTGRVVDATELPADVPGDRALVVLEAERIGDGDTVHDAAADARERLQRGVRASIYRSIEGLEPVTLPNATSPTIAQVSDVPASANASETVTIAVTVANDGWERWSDSIELRNGSTTLANVTVDVGPGAASIVELTWNASAVGNHTLAVEGAGVETAAVGNVTVRAAHGDADGKNETDGGSDGQNGNDESSDDGSNDDSGQDDNDSGDSGGGLGPPPGSGDDGNDENNDNDEQNDSDEQDDADGGTANESESAGGDEPADDEGVSESADDSNAAPENETDPDGASDGGAAGGPTGDDGSPGFGVLAALLALLGLGAGSRQT